MVGRNIKMLEEFNRRIILYIIIKGIYGIKKNVDLEYVLYLFNYALTFWVYESKFNFL
jgi:hypothetical protein